MSVIQVSLYIGPEKDFMKKFLKLLILFLLFGAVVYQFRGPIYSSVLSGWSSVSGLFSAPCEKPIPYNLGTFDTRFNISKDYFLGALADAEAIWEKPSGINLFAYMPKDTNTNVLKVNLIYDYRQQATSKLASVGIVVKDTQASYDSLKAKFLKLKAEYEIERDDLNADIAAFNRHPGTE